jgi:hypothetical protein
MISTAGGMRAGHDAARKERLDEMVTEGYLSLEQPKFQMPDQPAAEPTYRMTEKGREALVV